MQCLDACVLHLTMFRFMMWKTKVLISMYWKVDFLILYVYNCLSAAPLFQTCDDEKNKL